jgi:hypothetical protein
MCKPLEPSAFPVDEVARPARVNGQADLTLEFRLDLGAIHNQHHINKTTVRVIESPGTIAQREIDYDPNLGALGAILYLRTYIDLFSKQMVVAIRVTNTETIYRGHCTPRECRESDG